MNVSLRAPTDHDYLRLASWITDAAACRRWAGPGVAFPFTASELPSVLAIDGGESYCLGDGTAEPLGFGQYRTRPDRSVHLLRIIVCPQRRGEGLGRELCNRLISRALEVTEASFVTLNVYPDNAVAVSLYRSLGFRRDEAKSAGESVLMTIQAHSFRGT